MMGIFYRFLLVKIIKFFFRQLTLSLDLFFAPLNQKASRSLHLLVINSIKSINLAQEFSAGSFDIGLNQLSLIQRK